MATYKIGQKVKFNQGRGTGLIAKVIAVYTETKTALLDDGKREFSRKFSAIRAA